MPNIFDTTLLERIQYQEGTLWEFYLTRSPSRLFQSGNVLQFLNDIAAVANDITLYKFLVTDVSFPPIRNVETEFDEATKRSYSVKSAALSDVSITFRETENFSVHNLLRSIQRRNFNTDRGTFTTQDPRMDGIVTFYSKPNRGNTLAQRVLGRNRSPEEGGATALSQFFNNIPEYSNAFQVGKVFYLKGMTLTTIDDMSLSYTNSDPLTRTATFSLEVVQETNISDLLGAQLTQSIGTASSLLL